MFRFRLDKILDLIKALEEKKKLELAQALTSLRKVEADMGAHERSLQDLRRFSGSQEWLLFRSDKASFETKELQRLHLVRLDKQKIYERKKVALTQVTARRKALEKLREKRLTEFKRDQSRKEQKVADDRYLENQLRSEEK